MKYRNEHCTPKRIEDCVVGEDNLICPMQDLNDHQLKKNIFAQAKFEI